MVGVFLYHLSCPCVRLDAMPTSGSNMLDVLQRHMEARPYKCVVNQWIDTLGPTEKDAFEKIKENNKKIQLALLYTELESTTELPFKTTAFRSHFRGYCSCKK